MTQISADAQVFLIGLLRKFEQDDGYVDFTEWTATWEALQSRYPEVAHVRDEFRYVIWGDAGVTRDQLREAILANHPTVAQRGTCTWLRNEIRVI